jgi:YNFM family putative membrane transporter
MADYIQKGTRQYWQAISALFLGSVAAFGLEYCVQPIIPLLTWDFNLSPSIASLAMSCGTGGMALAMIFIAGSAVMLDRKKTMSIALSVSAILAILMAISPNFYLILVLRLIQGFLLAAFPSLAIAYISEEFSPDIVGLAVGIYVSGTTIGGLLGRLVLSAMTDLFSWRIGLGALGVFFFIISIWFYFALTKSRRHVPSKTRSTGFVRELGVTLRNKKLIKIYIIAFAACGSFVAMYNYIAFPLMAPPYNLSQTAIGALFAVYLVGILSSTLMGGMSDKYGCGKILCFSIGIMLIGAVITLLPSLIIKITGLAIFTFGFFGTHSTACSWTGKSCKTDKAQGSALYMLFYYLGSSVIGTIGGLFLSNYNWPGLIMLITIILSGALWSAKLAVSEEFSK